MSFKATRRDHKCLHGASSFADLHERNEKWVCLPSGSSHLCTNRGGPSHGSAAQKTSRPPLLSYIRAAHCTMCSTLLRIYLSPGQCTRMCSSCHVLHVAQPARSGSSGSGHIAVGSFSSHMHMHQHAPTQDGHALSARALTTHNHGMNRLAKGPEKTSHPCSAAGSHSPSRHMRATSTAQKRSRHIGQDSPVSFMRKCTESGQMLL